MDELCFLAFLARLVQVHVLNYWLYIDRLHVITSNLYLCCIYFYNLFFVVWSGLYRVIYYVLQGLISNVTFGGQTLAGWSMIPLNITKIFDNLESNTLKFRFAFAVFIRYCVPKIIYNSSFKKHCWLFGLYYD